MASESPIRGARALVTGVAGFLGRHVAEACLELGMQVVGIDDLSGGFVENVPEGVAFVRGSVCDDSLVRQLTETERFDFIYHLAAYAAEGLSHFIRRFNYTNNLIGSVTLINAAARTKVRCFVFTSSIAVYGRNQVPMKEEFTPQPEDPYGISKYAVELDLKAAHEMFGLDFVVFRPHNVYGEYQNVADTYRNVVGIFMNQVLRGFPMAVFGDGLQSRAFSHVDDVAPVIARAPLVSVAYNQVFNVGADAPCTVLELAREVARAFGVPPRIQQLPPRNEVTHAYASHERVRRVFPALRQPIILREGIARMARWVRAAGPRLPVRFDDIEVIDNLPPSWHRETAAVR
jgi:UDP-glucose 4-epimerase